MDTKSASIFLSYATPDRERVIPYFEYLEGRGHSVWMDFKCIKAGQNWDFEIRRALDRAVIIVVFISENSIDRRSYLQREIKIALDKYQEKLTSDIYVIPVLLDDGVAVPDQVKSIQCVRVSEGGSEFAIDDAIRHQLDVIGAASEATQQRSGVSWHQNKHKETWDGLPGYEVEYSAISLSSKEYPFVSDISAIIRADLIKMIMDYRSIKFSQQPDWYNFADDKYRRMSTFESGYSEPIVTGKIISIQYASHYYHVGAAHPNMSFSTYAFILDPLIRIESLESIFFNKEDALSVISAKVREQLFAEAAEAAEAAEVTEAAETAEVTEDMESFGRKWVIEGTSKWSSFDSFVFKEDGIEVMFAPYSVSCYADGPRFAKIDYKYVVEYMEMDYIYALDIRNKYWDIVQAMIDSRKAQQA